GLAEQVLGHSGVIERHIVVGLELDDQLHDGPGRLVVAGVGDRVPDAEDYRRSIGTIVARETLYHGAGLLDPPGERVAGSPVALAVSAAGSGISPLPHFHFHRIPQCPHPRQPPPPISPTPPHGP